MPDALIDERNQRLWADINKEYTITLEQSIEPNYVIQKFALFILYRDVDAVATWTAPFVNAFNATEEAGNLISEIVSAEDFSPRTIRFGKRGNAIIR